ncbi:MAG: DUF389 domain-containing protein [Chloroflexi bacterium]|nr:DUF389 domain-containing protein [Chloroflexota bacterium]
MPAQNANNEKPTVKARRVLVPLANPNTAMGLLRLAWKLAHPEHGRVFALFVTLTSQEPDGDAYDQIAKVVEEAAANGIDVELVSRTAPSVARGILDGAREHGATLMVLGFQAPVRGKIELGPIVESVARTTPCDLVVFRNPLHSHLELDDVEQVMLPLDGSENSRVAARLGLVLAEVYDARPHAIYVQVDPDLPSWFGLARIEASLTNLGDTRHIQRQVVRANDMVSGVLSRCDKADMIVLGFTEQSSLDKWIFGNVTQRMLAQAPGPVILAKRAAKADLSAVQQLRRRIVTRFSPVLTPSERTEVIRQASELSLTGINYIVLTVISALLACFGLLQNSAAVIIGAMLVAPLMSPLMAVSVSVLQGRLRVVRTAMITTLAGVAMGLGVAFVLGLVYPIDTPTTEMLARGQPSVLDMGVALASGAVGAYAMARKDIPAALAGVAIAAALVPPLCTIGLALAFGELGLAAGAGLLFTTNIVSISLAGAVVFAWLGIRPARGNRTRQQVIISLLVLSVLAVPLGNTFIDVARTSQETSEVRSVLEDQFPDSDVIEVELQDDDVTATIRSENEITRADVEAAELALKDKLGHDVDLEVTFWRAITP